MTQPSEVKNDCVLTRDSIYLNCKQDPAFIAFYFLTQIIVLNQAIHFYWPVLINLILMLTVRNPFIATFWYQLGYGEKYKSHTYTHLGLFRLFIVNGRVFTVLPRLSDQVAARLDQYRKLSNA